MHNIELLLFDISDLNICAYILRYTCIYFSNVALFTSVLLHCSVLWCHCHERAVVLWKVGPVGLKCSWVLQYTGVELMPRCIQPLCKLITIGIINNYDSQLIYTSLLNRWKLILISIVWTAIPLICPWHCIIIRTNNNNIYYACVHHD